MQYEFTTEQFKNVYPTLHRVMQRFSPDVPGRCYRVFQLETWTNEEGRKDYRIMDKYGPVFNYPGVFISRKVCREQGRNVARAYNDSYLILAEAECDYPEIFAVHTDLQDQGDAAGYLVSYQDPSSSSGCAFPDANPFVRVEEIEKLMELVNQRFAKLLVQQMSAIDLEKEPSLDFFDCVRFLVDRVDPEGATDGALTCFELVERVKRVVTSLVEDEQKVERVVRRKML